MFQVFLVLDWDGNLGAGKRELGQIPVPNAAEACQCPAWRHFLPGVAPTLASWSCRWGWEAGDYVSISFRVLLILHHIEGIFRDPYRLKGLSRFFTYIPWFSQVLSCVGQCVVRPGRAVRWRSLRLHLPNILPVQLGSVLDVPLLFPLWSEHCNSADPLGVFLDRV